jgi:hypothetical protein
VVAGAGGGQGKAGLTLGVKLKENALATKAALVFLGVRFSGSHVLFASCGNMLPRSSTQGGFKTQNTPNPRANLPVKCSKVAEIEA